MHTLNARVSLAEASGFSPGFLEILRFCSHVREPNPHDLKALIAIYRCLRKGLEPKERRYTARLLWFMRLKSK
jgi:hypothetical protein